jgi:hypothetical protein
MNKTKKVKVKNKECEADFDIENCGFEFRCPKLWSELQRPTENENLRFCGVCKENVYLCSSVKEMDEHAAQKHCVAVPAEILQPSAKPLAERRLFKGIIISPLSPSSPAPEFLKREEERSREINRLLEEWKARNPNRKTVK